MQNSQDFYFKNFAANINERDDLLESEDKIRN